MHIRFIECKLDIERFATAPINTAFVVCVIDGKIYPAAVDSLVCDLWTVADIGASHGCAPSGIDFTQQLVVNPGAGTGR